MTSPSQRVSLLRLTYIALSILTHLSGPSGPVKLAKKETPAKKPAAPKKEKVEKSEPKPKVAKSTAKKPAAKKATTAKPKKAAAPKKAPAASKPKANTKAKTTKPKTEASPRRRRLLHPLTISQTPAPAVVDEPKVKVKTASGRISKQKTTSGATKPKAPAKKAGRPAKKATPKKA